MDTIISCQELSQHLGDADWCVFDCRFSLADPAAGADLYAAGHVTGAIYADLERDLSGPIIPGTTGRHPLPDRDEWLERVRNWGVTNSSNVVAYDDAGGAFAARLWWMLRWLGHERAAVLDGGWGAWVEGGYPVTAAPTAQHARSGFEMHAPLTRTIASEALLERVKEETIQLIDARDAARYRGEVEPIDPVAGHIPGAHCLPFAENLTAGGTFKPPDELVRRFLPLLDDAGSSEIVHYCGSGVTATHNILAMVHAGLPEPVLYAGSWSEWIVDPHRPVERG